MDYYTVKRFALALAIQAEIEGMKAKNRNHDYATYSEEEFNDKALELRNLAYMHDDQL